MSNTEAAKSLSLAKQHLKRVLDAWEEPTDWSDLTMYGFYCLEISIVAAAAHLGMELKKTHPAKAEMASELSRSHSLPDITDFLWDLNSARKAAAYGDVDFPVLDAEDVASKIEEYVEAVSALLGDEPNEQSSDEQDEQDEQ